LLTEFFSQEFNPSPFSTRYFSVQELGKLLQDNDKKGTGYFLKKLKAQSSLRAA
jgi:hypothetical protein